MGLRPRMEGGGAVPPSGPGLRGPAASGGPSPLDARKPARQKACVRAVRARQCVRTLVFFGAPAGCALGGTCRGRHPLCLPWTAPPVSDSDRVRMMRGSSDAERSGTAPPVADTEQWTSPLSLSLSLSLALSLSLCLLPLSLSLLLPLLLVLAGSLLCPRPWMAPTLGARAGDDGSTGSRALLRVLPSLGLYSMMAVQGVKPGLYSLYYRTPDACGSPSARLPSERSL